MTHVFGLLSSKSSDGPRDFSIGIAFTCFWNIEEISLFNIVARNFSRGFCIVDRSFSQGFCIVARNFARGLCIVARNFSRGLCIGARNFSRAELC